MSKDLPVTLNNAVIYHIQLKDSFSDLGKELINLGYMPDQKFCIVSDSNVAPLYEEEICTLLKESGYQQVYCYTFQAGEASKNTSTVNDVYEYLIGHHFDRHDVLIALGGGVVGDLAGFVAASYMRGIDFYNIPTTVLSQVDSSVGGEVTVDRGYYKNNGGAF